MSADNGIYILKTVNPSTESGYEYRVKHVQGIDNIDWDDDIKDYTTDDNIRIKNAREEWFNCQVFHDEPAATKRAYEINEQVSWTEYGVCIITINEKF